MSESHQAVFLSHASQDAVAALRIAVTLRAARIVVWFDKDELTGGDAWDAKTPRTDCELCVVWAGDFGEHADTARGIFSD